MAQVARRGEALGDREAGPGMTAVEHVVGRFRAAREAADAVDLAERAEPVKAAGQELVRVRLVAGVPDDPVARRLEESMEDDRELDHAERAAEVAAGVGDGLDDRLADLAGQLLELGVRRPRRSAGPFRFGRIATGCALSSFVCLVPARSTGGLRTL